MAVVRVYAQLIDDLKSVLAPVLDVHEGVVERCAIVADERFSVSEGACGLIDIWGDDLVQETLELTVCECDPIQCFELILVVCLKRGSITDVGTILVL